MFSRYFDTPCDMLALTGGRVSDFDIARILDYIDEHRRFSSLSRRDEEASLTFLERMAKLNMGLRRYDQALADIDRAMGVSAEISSPPAGLAPADLFYLQGKVLLRQAEYRTAEAALKQAVAAAEDRPDLKARALLQLGRVMAREGRHHEAIEMIRSVPEAAVSPRNHFQAKLDIVYSSISAGDLDEAEQVSQSIDVRANDDELAPSVWRYYQAWQLILRHRRRDGMHMLEHVREDFTRLQFKNGVAVTELSLAQTLFETCEFDACQQAAERAISAAVRAGSVVVHAAALVTSGRAYFVSGEAELAIQQFAYAHNVAEAANASSWICRALQGRAEVHTMHEDFSLARADLEECLSVRHRIGDRSGEGVDLLHLAKVYRQQGQWDEATAHHDRVQAIASEIDDHHLGGLCCASRAEALLATGELTEAWNNLIEAEAIFREHHHKIHLIRVLKHQAQLQSLREEWTRSFELSDQALELAREEANPIVLAETLISRALTHHDMNDDAVAQKRLTSASEALRGVRCPPLQEYVRRLQREIEQRSHAKVVLSKYLDRRVVDRLLARPERQLAINIQQDVTVLFSDIRSYSTLSEKLSAKDVVNLLNDHFEAMTEVISSHGGIIDKFIGDAIMAVFGAPGHASSHDAQDAVLAGLEMVERREQMNAERVAHGDEPVRIGVGIYTGPVVMGHIGSSKHMNYTVIGDAVNVAARLEALTKTYEVPIIIGETTRASVGDEVPCREIDRTAVRGREQITTIYAPSAAP